jgi:hypothetical protein
VVLRTRGRVVLLRARRGVVRGCVRGFARVAIVGVRGLCHALAEAGKSR